MFYCRRNFLTNGGNDVAMCGVTLDHKKGVLEAGAEKINQQKKIKKFASNFVVWFGNSDSCDCKYISLIFYTLYLPQHKMILHQSHYSVSLPFSCKNYIFG